MQLKYQTNTPLAAGAQYIGAWQDNGPGGANPGHYSTNRYVRVTAYSDQPGSLALYEADSPTGLFNAQVCVDQVLASGGALATIEAAITAQFWQAIYTNGPTAQTQFQHYAFSSPDMQLAIWQQLVRLNQQFL